MPYDWLVEGLGNADSGDVIMSRTNTSGSEDVVEFLSYCVQSVNNSLFDIRNDPCFSNLDPPFAEGFGDIVQIDVLSAAGQNFVAYY